jgi:CDP-4-dehydro-6-deoxyglucose reductase
MRVSLSKSGRSYRVGSDQSLLDAAFAAGLDLPSSCRRGNCGSCRARLLEGRIEYPLGRPLGLAAAEVADGFVLLCQARARTDVVVDLIEMLPARTTVIKRLPCRIERVEDLSHDVKALFLRLPAAEDFRFEAGQYIDVMLSRGRRRSFSIASAPHESRLLELHVRRVPGGEFTDGLFREDKVRALLTIEGPLGHFIHRAESPGPLLFIGGGTGVAPLLSIAQHLVAHAVDRPLHWYWGVRSERDLYADERLRELSAQRPNWRYVPVLSEPSDSWQGRRGWVHEAALCDIPNLADFAVYASGPPALVAAVRRDFVARGVDARRLYFDSFDYAPA